ncbi:MAG: FKBP-type peptidyl-prolyl cis-trans isomerase [Candidatus Hydrogenedentes bacterium]|nr:FKBP-type peptidyl-prolyl cis-trans isomerase [Candidatus Hydrogenedentota bacterium]
MLKTLAAVAVTLCLAASAFAADEKEKSTATLADDNAKTSYAIGAQVGESLKLPGFEVNLDAFVAGIEDAVKGREAAMTTEEITAVMTAFQTKMRESMMAEQNKEKTANLSEGQKYLDENAKKDGVKITESGLQYKVVQEGTGASPKPTDEVTVHYTGTLLNGEKFDSSVDRGEPATFRLDQVIPGWTEGLQLMKEGGKCQFYVPAELAYGERGRPSIPANSVLIFDVELIKVTANVEIPAGAQPINIGAQ